MSTEHVPTGEGFSDPIPPIGVTPAPVLAQKAAAGSRGAAWRLLLRVMEHDPHAVAAIAALNDDRLAQNLLEWMALGTWAGKHMVVPPLLRSPFARQRLNTLWLSGSGIDSRRVEQVLMNALHDHRAALRETAANLLGLFGKSTATAPLIEATHDPVLSVQLQATKALGHLGNPAAVPVLLRLLRQADSRLSNQICSSLVRLGPVAVPALLRDSTSPSTWIRWYCVRALGEMHHVLALPVLVEALADSDQSVAWMAAKGLVPFGRSAVGPLLRLLISTPMTPWLAETASYVLSHQRNPDIKPYLTPVLQQMHTTGFRVGTALAARNVLTHLIAGGLAPVCGIAPASL